MNTLYQSCYQLVLVGSDSSEEGLREGEGLAHQAPKLTRAPYASLKWSCL